MSNLGKLWFELGIKDKTDKDIAEIRKNVEKRLKALGVDVKITPDLSELKNLKEVNVEIVTDTDKMVRNIQTALKAAETFRKSIESLNEAIKDEGKYEGGYLLGGLFDLLAKEQRDYYNSLAGLANIQIKPRRPPVAMLPVVFYWLNTARLRQGFHKTISRAQYYKLNTGDLRDFIFENDKDTREVHLILLRAIKCANSGHIHSFYQYYP